MTQQNIRMTPQRQRLLDDLNAGAKFMVTYQNDESRKSRIIEVTGGGKHSDGVVEGLFNILRDQGKLAESDNGLFPGCGQCFELIR